ncbi:MAG: sodium:solute symporter family protein, partial [Clostridia bacterium]|nr:sodium:solute symporter family protein [Clostridia bacterium]
AMNIVHASCLYGGSLLVAVLAYLKVGSLSVVTETLGSSFLSLSQPTLQSVVGTAVGSMFDFILSSTLVANVYSARSKKAANTGVLVAAFLVIIFAMLPAFIGVAGKILTPEAEAGTIFYTVADQFGNLVGGLASMAIIAAVFSTAPALLLTLSTTLTRDFYVTLVNKNATGQQQLRFSKLAIIGIGIIATFFGMKATSILGQIAGAFQIRSVAGLVLIICCYWKKADKRAAFWAILCGGIVAAVWHFAGQPFGIVPFWPGNAVGLIILVGLTLTNGYKVSPDYAVYKEHMDAIAEADL